VKAIPLFLRDDVVSFIDNVAKHRSAKANREVSRSEVVDDIVTKHWINIQKAKANKRFDNKLAQKQARA